MEDIKAGKLILYHPGTVSLEIVQLQNKLSESKKLSDLYFCDSEEAALILVQAGLGVAVLPDIFTSDTLDTENNFNNLKSAAFQMPVNVLLVIIIRPLPEISLLRILSGC